MRVERGRGALVAVAEPEAGDAAAQAVERLGVSLKGIPQRDTRILHVGASQ
jgi:hypothetical protein